MLKREVPTGPAADLLRSTLHALLPGSVERREVEQFLAGAPTHSPLPWGTSNHGNAVGLTSVGYANAGGAGFIANGVAEADAEFIATACNNFYALRSAALDYFELERGGDIGNLLTSAESKKLGEVLVSCGVEIKT